MSFCKLGMRQRRTHHAGLAVVQGRHGVEQMGKARQPRSAAPPRPARNCRVVWPSCTLKPSATSCADQRLAAAHLGRQRDQADGRERMQAVNLLKTRRAAANGGCAPKRASLMYGPSRCTPSTRAASGAGAVHEGCECGKGGVQVGLRRGHGGGKQRCGAVLRMQARHVPGCVAAFHDVVPAPPCTCRSMKPGSTMGALLSRTWASLTGSPVMPAMRPSAPMCRLPRTKPVGVRMWPCRSECRHGVLRSSATKA